MKLLFVTQRVDAEHDILGFVADWVAALAAADCRVEVVAQWLGRHSLPPTVGIHTLGKELGRSRIAQVVALQRLLARLVLAPPRVDVILCHMCPEYVPVCAPLAYTGGVPLDLWYTHGSSSPSLGVALRLVRRVYTASSASFPFAHPKVVAVGHGVDTVRFAPSAMATGDRRVVVSIGRLSPVKDHQLVVRAVAAVLRADGRRDLELRIVGGVPRADQASVRTDLEHLIRELGVGDAVRLVGPVPYGEVHHHLAAGHIFVSASRTGSLDKTVLEAMACARPVLVSNRAFVGELAGLEPRLLFTEGDVGELTTRLRALLTLPVAELESLGHMLRERLVGRHDLASFPARLLAAVGGRQENALGDP